MTRLEPGTYELEVDDLAEEHNFRLRGPGVDRATSVEGTGRETWTVTLRGRRLRDPLRPALHLALRSASGAVLRSLKPGAYAIVVRDRTRAHNFHLVGSGVNRRTAVAGTGTFTWRVTLRPGTLRFFSDRAPKTVKGSVRVT